MFLDSKPNGQRKPLQPRGVEYADQRRKYLVFSLMTPYIILVDFGYGAFMWSTGSRLGAGLAIGNALFQSVSLLWYLRDRKYLAAVFRLSLGVIILMFAALFTAPTLGESVLYVIATFPLMPFFLGGRRDGLRIAAIYFAVFLPMVALELAGFDVTFVTASQMVNAALSASLVFVLAYAAASAQEKFRLEIIAQREKMDVILRGLPVGVIVFDAPDGSVSVSNDTAAALLEKPVTPEVTASTFARTFGLAAEDGSALSQQQMPAVVALRERRRVAADLYAGTPERRRVLSTVAAPVFVEGGEVASAVLVLEDSTKRYEVDQMKSEFVSLASHQLKTPLSGLAWSLESVIDDPDVVKRIPADVNKTLVFAYDAVKKMTALVSDLLNVSRIDTGRKFDLHPEPCDGAPIPRLLHGARRPGAPARHQFRFQRPSQDGRGHDGQGQDARGLHERAFQRREVFA
ncbi:MAG: hypothetical protein RLZZ324_1174 [Candidatus Parcubacteria bacterium]|jgi:signal transduction histidine kinase